MNAKTRYRQRRKLQAALTRVLEVLADNVADGIPADKTTALMCWQVVGKLFAFIKAAGVDAEELPVKSDLSRFVDLKKARQKETHARYRRSGKHRAANPDHPPTKQRKARSAD